LFQPRARASRTRLRPSTTRSSRRRFNIRTRSRRPATGITRPHPSLQRRECQSGSATRPHRRQNRHRRNSHHGGIYPSEGRAEPWHPRRQQQRRPATTANTHEASSRLVTIKPPSRMSITETLPLPCTRRPALPSTSPYGPHPLLRRRCPDDAHFDSDQLSEHLEEPSSVVWVDMVAPDAKNWR